MNPVQIIQSFVNTESLHKASLVHFKPGQLLYGRVEQMLPNNTAIVQVGNGKLTAHLQAALSTTDRYLFEVLPKGQEGLQLKIVEARTQNDSLDFLFQQSRIPKTKQNLRIVDFLFSKNIPFTKEQFKALTNLNSNQLGSKELTAIEWMIKRDLPITQETFHSLVAVQESESFMSQLAKAGSYLENSTFASSNTLQALKEQISTVIGDQSIIDLGNGFEVKQMLQNLVKALGFEYEKDMMGLTKDKQNIQETLHTLKPLLIDAIKELGTSGKELNPLLHRLTGMQLLSQDPSGPLQHIYLQLPISFGEKQTDITLQWNGRKTEKGQIDADFCRILFYLDLQSLKQTIIDMQIQNRVIHVSIINDTKDIDPLVKVLAPSLKEKLEVMGYTLSFIKVNPSNKLFSIENKQISTAIFPMPEYQKVDIKI